MIRVVDCDGIERDWAWLVARYGELVIHPAAPGPGWRVVELWENADPSAVQGVEPALAAPFGKVDAAPVIVVKTEAPTGAAIPGVRVAWYWPDAPADGEAGPANGLPAGMRANRAVNGTTNEQGVVGFGMGAGAYYWPNEGQIGPHAVWVYGVHTNSDVVLGLGMLGGTNHSSLWPMFEWQQAEPEPPEPPSDDIAALCDQIVALAEEIRRLAGQ